MKKLETIVTLIQKPTEVEFTCPYCKSDVSEDFEEFLDEQGLSWSDFPDWEYEPIKCPFCENEIEAEYEFDWGGRMNNRPFKVEGLDLNEGAEEFKEGQLVLYEGTFGFEVGKIKKILFVNKKVI